MARKKIEPITSLGKSEDKLLVQKSLPLFALWQSDLTLAEFKILDTYLSRIDSHNPDKRAVMFEKGELEEILGVKKINTNDLKARLKHLMENVVEVTDKDDKKGFKLVALFEEAEAEQDDYGIWQVKLECTQKAMKYIFNIENLGYLRYKLRCVTSITSRYTYIMFAYLEHNRYRKTWEVDLNELKRILDCDKEETYKEYKRFNDRLLKRVYAEMHEKTECKYDYEPIKKGRSVVAIRFTVHTLAHIEVVEAKTKATEHQLTIEEYLESQENSRDDICYGFSDAEFESFSNEELELLKNISWSKKDEQRVKYHNDVLDDFQLACEYATSEYIREKILLAKIKKPKNLFLYVKKMIEND